MNLLLPRARFGRLPAILVAAAILVPAHAAETTKRTASLASAKAVANRPAFSFSIEPAPAWVVPAKERADVRVDKAPMHFRVVDEQTRLEGRTAVAFSRVVRVVNDQAGLGAASQIEVVFEPSYQALAIHHLEVVRNGKRLNRLDRRKIQLLQRETQLERSIYDGRVSASVVLDDVRVGDEIDFAYSIKGVNPVFDGRFVENNWMVSSRGPVALFQYRLVAPESRNLKHRVGSPEIQVEGRIDGTQRELVFRRESVPLPHFDANAPHTSLLRHQVLVSEFGDWAEVAKWGATLFSDVAARSEALDRKAAELKALSTEAGERVLAALKFVQSEVRYFGTEVGLNSHKPASPEKVMGQRFGDCKDKVQLLLALLRRMDIAADPVLVSTTLHQRVDEMIPTALAFDHAIARVRLGGKTYWLDPTRNHQTGTLDSRQMVGFGQGLVLDEGAQGLTALPMPYEHERMSVRDVFTVDRFEGPVQLEARITYRGDMAEIVRESLASRNLAETQAQVTKPYAKNYPGIEAVGGLGLESSPTEDAITLVLKFSLPEFWRLSEDDRLTADLVHWSVSDALSIVHEPVRRDPFSLERPGIYRHVSVVEYPEEVFKKRETKKTEDADRHFVLRNTVGGTLRSTEYTSEVRLLSDRVMPQDWTSFTSKVNKLASRLSVTVSIPSVSPERADALQREMERLGDAMDKKRLRFTTPTQEEAHLKLPFVEAQLASGRLPLKLKAQVLRWRALLKDNIGQLDDAARDYEASLKLDPEVPETLNAAAINEVARGNHARALALAASVLEKDSGNSGARNATALAKYFSGDIAGARLSIEELLKDEEQVRRGYPLVWLSLVHRGAPNDSSKLLQNIEDDRLPTEWPRPLVDWARGKASTEAVMQAAKAGSGSTEAERLCEAYFWIGERYLANGETHRAIEYFRKALEQKVFEFIEDSAARLRLASLKAVGR